MSVNIIFRIAAVGILVYGQMKKIICSKQFVYLDFCQKIRLMLINMNKF